jgi:hypothetical protein
MEHSKYCAKMQKWKEKSETPIVVSRFGELGTVRL